MCYLHWTDLSATVLHASAPVSLQCTELAAAIHFYASCTLAFSALTLLVGRLEGHLACKN